MMAKDPAERHQTGRELIRDLARLREGLSGQTFLVARASLGNDPPAPPSPLSSQGRGTPAATTGMMVRPSRRIAWIAVVALSLVAAAALGGAAAWMRRPPAEPPPPVPSADAGEIDDDLPLNDEELHKVVEQYLRAAKTEDVPVTMSLCLELGTRYLDQHRLDDAEKLFEKLEGTPGAQPYHLLGRLGRAIVFALRDQADESNKLFGQIFPESGQKDLPKRLGKMWTNAQFRFWLAQAASCNARNGVPDKDVPTALKQLSDPHPHP